MRRSYWDWRRSPRSPRSDGNVGFGSQVADINGDGRLDIVMIGGATYNIKWYENLGVNGN